MEKITKESLKLTFPELPPQKGVGDYIKSKITAATLQLRADQWDKPSEDPDLKLSGCRRKLAEVESILNKRKEMYKLQRIDLDGQWKELKENEKQFGEMFKTMNAFIKSNRTKRKRASERLKEDLELQRVRMAEIEEIKKKIQDVEATKLEMEQQVAHHRVYEIYLDKVVGESIEFTNVNNIINRYESLVQLKTKLAERQNTTLTRLEAAKSDLSKMCEVYAFKILGLTNTLTGLQGRYMKVLQNSLHWENTVWNIKKCAFNKIQEINEIKQSAWNLYKMMCKRKNEPPKIPEWNLEKQLNYIKKTLAEIGTIKQRATKIRTKKITSLNLETSKS